jgi:F5/8 type C domain
MDAARGKLVTGNCPPNSQYPASGLASLVDGEMGGEEYEDAAWMGWWYEDKPFEVTIDLGAVTAIHTLGVNTLSASEVWILFPRKIEFELSTDGKAFKRLAPVRPSESDLESEDIEAKTFELSGLKERARYVRVRVERFGELPESHMAYGGAEGVEGEAWLFVDEILVNPK